MKSIGIAIVFIAVVFILFMGISMISQIPEPGTGTEEYTQFEGLSKIVNIGYTGFYAVLLIIMAIAVIMALQIGSKKGSRRSRW